MTERGGAMTEQQPYLTMADGLSAVFSPTF